MRQLHYEKQNETNILTLVIITKLTELHNTTYYLENPDTQTSLTWNYLVEELLWK